MNTTVEASGMQLTAVTPINLLINNDNSGDFKNSVLADEAYTGKLYPASSADGKKFNAIMNAGNYIGEGLGGVAVDNTTFQKSSSVAESKVVAMNGANDGYWAEYTFGLKLSQAQDDAATVYLSKINFYAKTTVAADAIGSTELAANPLYTYDDETGVFTQVTVEGENKVPAGDNYYSKSNSSIAGACRAALYTGATAGAKTTLINIYSNADDNANAVYGDIANDNTAYSSFKPGSITADSANVKTVSSVAPTTVTAGAGGNATATNSFEVNDTAVHVTLVVWIEGQDAQCLNANAGQTLKVELAFSVAQVVE